ncbi:MAG: hypothetical protein Q7R69_02855 [bacterium]|nr:hypothetical protein [bacterium]
MIHKTKTISYDHRARVFWILVAISILSLFAYIYAIHATARNIATRQNLERQMAKISANLGSLEFDYIELKNNVSLELAYQHGFREAKKPLYVSRTSVTSLSFNTLSR